MAITLSFCISTSTTNWAEVLLQQILEKEKLRSPLSDEDFLLNSFFPRYPQDIRIVRSTKMIGVTIQSIQLKSVINIFIGGLLLP